jgi:hypothetical protein
MAVDFYGRALDTLYTGTNVYWLIVSAGFASPIGVDDTTVEAGSTFAPYYLETSNLNRQKGYAFHSPLSDPWYDTGMLAYKTPKSWAYTLQIDNLVANAAAGTLQVNLYGGTDWPDVNPDHHVIVNFNAQPVAETFFNATEHQRLIASLPAGSFVNGANTLTLTLPGDTGVDYELVDFDNASITYPRAFLARNGSLTFKATGDAFRVDGLTSPDIAVYRIDAAGVVTRLTGATVTPQSSTIYSAAFPGSSSLATYIVTGAASMLKPGIQAAPRQTDITSGKVDFLIISHPDFIAGVQPLVQARQGQGYRVRVVNVDDIYQQFSYGIFDAQAIRRYIRYAIRNMGTRYVLLVGGDTYDYRNYVYTSAISFMPSLYVETHPLVRFAPSDVLYADIDNDDVPEAAIGRFPVRTSGELSALIAKTLAYGSITYRNTGVFAVDTSEPGAQFGADSNTYISQLGSDWTVTRAYLDEMPVSTAQSTLIDAMNRGVALTSFIGHSSYTVWTFQGLFNATQAGQLTNAGKPTVVTQWGCWNTYYISPAYNTLAHKFLLSGDRGAAAVMGTTTLTYSSSESAYGQLLVPYLVQPGMTIGDAMTLAKADLATDNPGMIDVLLGWVLLGDPTLTIVPGDGG